ncbi:MAG: hypothetical protein Hyperionvirus12_40 [Hyperionvirus sp.]|uniref:Uncharacterized protein n=1 Tax=Hyperionvirus sp. TaxID=2487770 RepID=A0A3G5AD69_9VIRU|nr:MAG: hypothetical protein Hyperionvirus12_40 [Hyperionvirus sp.]
MKKKLKLDYIWRVLGYRDVIVGWNVFCRQFFTESDGMVE